MTEPFWAWPLVIVSIGGLISCAISIYFNLTKPSTSIYFPFIISGMYDATSKIQSKPGVE